MRVLLALLLALTMSSCSDDSALKGTIRGKVGSSVVRIFGVTPSGHRSGGTGFSIVAMSGKRYILTNRHICKLADKKGNLLVEFPGYQRRYRRKIIEISTSHDLCLVESLPTFKNNLFIAEEVNEGDRIFVVGHPKLFNLTVAEGEYIQEAKIYIALSKLTYKPIIFKSRPLFTGEKIDIGVLLSRVARFASSRFNVYSRGGNSGSPIVNSDGDVISVLFAGNPRDNMETYGVPLRYVQDFIRGY